jgi:hypothetical protein
MLLAWLEMAKCTQLRRMLVQPPPASLFHKLFSTLHVWHIRAILRRRKSTRRSTLERAEAWSVLLIWILLGAPNTWKIFLYQSAKLYENLQLNQMYVAWPPSLLRPCPQCSALTLCIAVVASAVLHDPVKLCDPIKHVYLPDYVLAT